MLAIILLYAVAVHGTAVPIPPGMEGRWYLSYSNGHNDVYTITKDASITLRSENKQSTILATDNEAYFPTSEGWYLASNLYREEAWEYIRLKDDAILEVHHFCSDGCDGMYKGLEEYCCSAVGSTQAPTTTTVATTTTESIDIPAGLVGKWSLKYTNEHEDVYTITSDGSITLSSTNRNSKIVASDDQTNFPTSEGWYLAPYLYRIEAWEYVRLRDDGTLEVHYFCRDGCDESFKGREEYCCSAEGRTEVSTTTTVATTTTTDTPTTTTKTPASPTTTVATTTTIEDRTTSTFKPTTPRTNFLDIPEQMVGSWNLSYDNGRKNMYTINDDGSIVSVNNKIRRYIETSESNNFPSSQGWFMVKNLYRSKSWEYIRLAGDRVLEVHHFCSTSCKNLYHGVEKNYCCAAIGCKGGWDIVEGNITKVDADNGTIVGITTAGEILFRTGIKVYNQKGSNWTSIKTEPGIPKSIAMGDGKIAIINHLNQIFFRTRINENSPQGTGWKRITGKLKQISIGDGKILGVTPRNFVYYRTGIKSSWPFGTRWRKFGRMKQISVGGGIIVGVDRAGRVFVRIGISSRRPYGRSWKRIGGNMKMVQVGNGGQMMGVNNKNEVYERVGMTNRRPTAGRWERREGALEDITLGGGILLGVSSNQMFYRSKDCSVVRYPKELEGTWNLTYSNGHNDSYTIKKDGRITLASERKTQTLLASNDRKNFPASEGWYLASNLYRAEAWEYIRLKDDGTLEVHHFCNDGCDKTYDKREEYCCNGTGRREGKFEGWSTIEKKFLQVAAGNGTIIGITPTGEILYTCSISKNISKTSDWKPIKSFPGIPKSIAMGDGKIAVINHLNKVFFRAGLSGNLPLGTGWKGITGKIKQISMGDGKIMAINNRNLIYYRTGVTPSTPFGTRWRRLIGRLKQISVGDGFIVGVNRHNRIYVRIGITSKRPYGRSWKRIDGNLKMVQVGNGGQMMGVNNKNEVYERVGMTSEKPTAGRWERRMGAVKFLSLGNGMVVGIDGVGDLVYQ